MSEIRKSLSHNLYGLDVHPMYKKLNIGPFDDRLLKDIFRRCYDIIEFASCNDILFDRRTYEVVGFAQTYKGTLDKNTQVQECLPAIGRYTQNSQYTVNNPIWKTRNEISFRLFVRDCEFTFDLLFTPTGKSVSLLLDQHFLPHFKKDAYGEAFDERGLTKNVDVIVERIEEIVKFARAKERK